MTCLVCLFIPNSRIKMRIVLKFLLCILLGSLLAGALLTLIYGYTDTMTFLIHAIGEASRSDKILALVTARKLFILQILIFVICSVLLLIILSLDAILNYALSCLVYINKSLTHFKSDIAGTEVKWILCIPFVGAVFFALYMPVSYDEAWTYLQFTSKSPLSSLCYYPAPNNHVLHSLITNLTRYIPFGSALFCLRISSILASVVTWILCFSFLNEYYSKRIALLITAMTSMLFMSVYYSYMSRGYGLVMLFFIVSVYASYNIIRKGDQAKYWLCFTISNVLGFFTMPSFLYPFILLNIVILLNNGFKIKKQLVYNSAALFFVVVLYIPIIIVNGLNALINNPFVAPISRSEVLHSIAGFLSTTITEIFGVHYFFVLFALVVSIVVLLKNNMRFEFGLMIIFLLFPFVILTAHSVIPFPRTFNYYAFVLVFFICIPYWKRIEVLPVNYIVAFAILIQVVCSVNFYLNIKKYEEFNISYHEINNKILGNHRYFFTTFLFETIFLFENKTQGYKMEKAEFHFPQINVNADTLTGFDYYIVDKEFDFTKNKKPAYSDRRTNVYEEYP